MTGIDKAVGRVVALIALLFVVAIALRGYLPGDGRPHSEESTHSTASVIGVDTLLIVSVIIVGIGVISALRRPRAPAASVPFALPGSFDGKLGWKPVRRMVLIGLGALLVWLLIVVLLSHLQLLQLPDLPFSQAPPNNAPGGTPPTAVPPPPPPSPVPPPPPQHSAFGYLLATTAAMLLLWGAAAMVRRTRRPDESYLPFAHGAETPIVESTPESLTRAAEFGLAEIDDRSRGPRESIIACYAAMERALADAPGAEPQDSDTPSEVLARAVEHHALHAGSATELVTLFAEARFSPHVMTERHREIAAQALRRVLAELRSLA